MGDGPKSHSLPITNSTVLDLIATRIARCRTILDLGAGEGYLSSRVLEQIRNRGLSTRLTACDLFPADFAVEGMACDAVDLNAGLPYESDAFDLVYSVEVFEHVENQFRLLKEVARVLRSGGSFVFTTPNVLNMTSRMRSFLFGFPELFEILPLTFDDPVTLGGHINPTSLYYACYMAERSGFDVADIRIDRAKRSSTLGLLLYPLIKLLEIPYRARLRRKDAGLYDMNRRYLDAVNSPRVLTGRTVILDLVKRS